jgi:hypothetical protein
MIDHPLTWQMARLSHNVYGFGSTELLYDRSQDDVMYSKRKICFSTLINSRLDCACEILFCETSRYWNESETSSGGLSQGLISFWKFFEKPARDGMHPVRGVGLPMEFRKLPP